VGTQILDDDIGFNNAIGFAHGTGIKVHGSNGLIQGNTIHDNDGPGVSLGQLADGTGADGERIQSNTITTNAGEGVQLTHACNILVDGNTITGNQLFAIDIQDSNTDSISNNIVSVPASSTYGGIRIMATKATAPNYDCGIWNDARHNDVLTNTVTMGTMANHGTYGNINGVVQTGGLLGAEVFTGNVYHVPSGGCAINNWYWWDGSVQRKATYPTWVSTYGQDAPPGSCGS